MNPSIDNKLSNHFGSNPAITYSQKTSLLKFHTGQYMVMQENNYFFGIERFPSSTCPICNSLAVDNMALRNPKM
jgi:hypothetical protein